jgi:hypothetical protein
MLAGCAFLEHIDLVDTAWIYKLAISSFIYLIFRFAYVDGVEQGSSVATWVRCTLGSLQE